MSNPQPTILVADDREDILKALRTLLRHSGYQVLSANQPETVRTTLEKTAVDLVLLDLNYSRDTTSGEEGLDLLAWIRAHSPDLPVVVMTAWASIELAMETMRRGARDFLEKPWDNQRLLSILKTQLELGRALQREQRMLAQNQQLHRERAGDMIAQSKAMRPVLDLIERVAPTDANVLITGEHGTGKGVCARQIHAQSARAGKPLITVNIGALSDSLFESELFGHVKGAFTDARQARLGRFALADGGTLFLDEIGNLSLPLQAKLLRVIETGEYEPVGSSRTERADVRLISATNADLNTLAAEGAYRQDLLFRLNTIEVRLPPLRDRPEDILPIARHFLARHGRKYGRPRAHFSQEAHACLLGHEWQGNVRELDHAVQRGVLMARSDTVEPADLGLSEEPAVPRLENLTLAEAERHLIQHALKVCNGNIKQAAKRLDLSRGALYRRLEKFGIDHDRNS